MAKKKVKKKVAMKPADTCATGESCHCNGILALIIIVLVWWKPAVMWSQITMTVAAAIILLSGNSCFCKK
ncbi:hypothetical protein HN903_00800 [archaeon]|nr:hypothetical protein [archaeon]MBT7128270.1 hypothetical protein [archaeon]